MSFLFRPRVYLVIIFFMQLAFWSYVTFRPVWIAPAGTKFALPQDQTLYVSFIRQAKAGTWCPVDTHTTRPQPETCSDVHLYFTVLGKIAAVFNLDPVFTYMAGQIVGGLVLTLAAFIFFSRFLEKTSLLIAMTAFAFFQIGPIFPFSLSPLSLVSPFPIAPMASSQLTLMRIFGLPHHTVGEALGIMVLVLMIDSYQHKMTILRAAGISVGTILAVLLLAPFVITLTITAVVSFFLWTVFTGTLKKAIPAFTFFEMSFVAIAAYLQLKVSQSGGSVLAGEEKTWWPMSQTYSSYTSSLLLFFPFIVISIVLLFLMRKQLSHRLRMITVIGVGWVALPYLVIPVTAFPWFPIAHFRVVDGYQYVPAALLVGIGFFLLKKLVSHKRILTILPYALFAVIMIISSLLSYHYYSFILAAQNVPYTNVDLPNGFWDAVKFFQTTGKNSNVMVLEYNGQLLADYAPIRTFLGRTAGFADWPERKGLAGWFFEGTRSDQTARDILTMENIDYVYVGDDELRVIQSNPLYPNVLTPVFQRDRATIYQFKK